MATKSPFVFDEKLFLETMQEGWSEIEDLFPTESFFFSDEAIRLFKKNRNELMISIIRMNNREGFEGFENLENSN